MRGETDIKNQINNDHGSSLLLVMIVIVMFTILGLSAMTLGLNNAKMSTSERKDQSAYYIAEAGIIETMHAFEKKINQIQANNEQEFFNQIDRIIASPSTPKFEEQFGFQPEAIVTVTKGNEKGTYTIESEGVIDRQSRTLTKNFTVKWNGSENDGDEGGPITIPPKLATFVSGDMSLTGAQIKGNVYSSLNQNDSIFIDWGTNISDGDIFVPAGYEHVAIRTPPHMNNIPEPQPMGESISFSLPPFPAEFPTYPTPSNTKVNGLDVIKNGKLTFYTNVNSFVLSMEENLSFTEIQITEDATLTIDVGHSDKAIVVDRLNIPQGHIQIKGDGNLTIYVKDQITIGGSSTINHGQPYSRLNMYLKGSGNKNNPKLLNYYGIEKIYGSLYAEDANIIIGGSGGFQGHIFTGGTSVEITGDASGVPAFIYAPNADISVHGSGKVAGSLIGKTLTTTGYVHITFQEFPIDQLPFFSSSSPKQEIGGIIDQDVVREQ